MIWSKGFFILIEIQTKFSTQELKELEVKINSFDNKKHQI